MAPLIGHGKTSSLSSQDPLRPRTRGRVDSRVYMRKAPASFDAEAFFLKKRRLPTLPRVCSTIGAGGLNFSVRNGKRWNPATITT